MSNKLRAHGITDNNVTLNFENGQTHIVSRTDALADEVIKALREGRRDEIFDMITATKQKIEKFGKGEFKVVDGRVHINGMPVPDLLSRKILKFQAEGLPSEPLVKFAEKELEEILFSARYVRNGCIRGVVVRKGTKYDENDM